MNNNHIHDWADPDTIAYGNLEELKKQLKVAYEKIRNNSSTLEVAKVRMNSIDQAIHDVERRNDQEQHDKEFGKAMRYAKFALFLSCYLPG